MNKVRIFLILFLGFLLNCICLIYYKDIQDFLFFEITKQESVFEPNLQEYYESFKPLRRWEIVEPQINAEAAISVAINNKGQKKVLFSKNTSEILPIASITKLMTALIVLENYNLSEKITISQISANSEGDSNKFRAGETFFVKDILYALLMESSNGAALALAQIKGQQNFIELMNQKAKELNLQNTRFFNAAGLDPDNPIISPNYSTTEDLASLGFFASKNPLILEILKTPEFDLYNAQGTFHHKIKNSNELLNSQNETEWTKRILGGKTGKTPLAKECFLLVLEGPRSNYLINVVLGSQNRFEEMKKITDWVFEGYKW